MVGVVPVVHAHRVMEEREEQHDLGIGAIRLRRNVDAVIKHAPPVRNPVQR